MTSLSHTQQHWHSSNTRKEIKKQKRKPHETPNSDFSFSLFAPMDFQVVVLAGGTAKNLIPLVSKVPTSFPSEEEIFQIKIKLSNSTITIAFI